MTYVLKCKEVWYRYAEVEAESADDAAAMFDNMDVTDFHDSGDGAWILCDVVPMG